MVEPNVKKGYNCDIWVEIVIICVEDKTFFKQTNLIWIILLQSNFADEKTLSQTCLIDLEEDQSLCVESMYDKESDQWHVSVPK